MRTLHAPACVGRERRDTEIVVPLHFAVVVERHPFGGFKMSGGGTKAGGREYLENFLFPRLIAENTLRRGFSPPEE